MKILHCCLAAFYIDNYGYQENIFPKLHQRDGYDVSLIASTETYINNNKLGYVKASKYRTKENIPIERISYTSLLPNFIGKKLRIYKNLYKKIDKIKPDIIFLHDCQFLSIIDVIKYKKNNMNTIIYVDSHTDFINSGRNWISKNILHKLIYKYCAKSIEPYVEKFYPTIPLRAEFLKSVYNISDKKIELLPLGLDDTNVDFAERANISNDIRTQLKINKNDFVVISGGKIDSRKKITNLMSAIEKLDNERIKLIIFGSTNNDTKEDVLKYSRNKNIIYISWLEPGMIYKYFFASDLAVFPGTHSVLWEEAVGLGIPCLFRKWHGIDHVDLGNNCLYLNDGSIDEIKDKILNLYNDQNKILDMKKQSIDKGIPYFSYTKIARKAIGMRV